MNKNMIKASSVVALSAAMILPTANVAVADNGCSFTDTNDTAVNWLCAEGIAVGYANGSFGVSSDITCGEVAAMLYRYSGEEHNPQNKQVFDDVKPTSPHYEAISWMASEGYTVAYADGDYRQSKPVSYGEVTQFLYRLSGEGEKTNLTKKATRGEVATLLYAMDTGEAAPAPSPSPTPPVVENPGTGSEGTGGQYMDGQAVSWSNGTVSSSYHIYADHLDGQTPHGVIVYMHGDGGWEYNDLKWSPTPEYVKIAREKNLMLVVPKTPDSGGTWWKKDSSGDWVADLYDHLGTTYNVDKSKAYWVGFSGGADTIAEQVISAHSDGWTGGGALMLGGGSMWGQPQKPISDQLKKYFPMHYLVGTNDDGSNVSDGYDAKSAAENSHKIYTNYGMTTKLTYIEGGNHVASAKAGPEYFRSMLK